MALVKWLWLKSKTIYSRNQTKDFYVSLRAHLLTTAKGGAGTLRGVKEKYNFIYAFSSCLMKQVIEEQQNRAENSQQKSIKKL